MDRRNFVFGDVMHHRLKYFLSPQFDLYLNIKQYFLDRADKLNMQKNYHILDYGCGNGIGAMLMVGSERDVDGIDNDPQMVNFANQLFGHLCYFGVDDWSRKNAFAVPNELFDVVTCIEVVEHVDEPRQLIKRLRQCVASDGIIFFSTLNHNSQYRKNVCHVGKYHVDDFVHLINEDFPGAWATDYTLSGVIEPDSTRTPVVVIWDGSGYMGSNG